LKDHIWQLRKSDRKEIENVILSLGGSSQTSPPSASSSTTPSSLPPSLPPSSDHKKFLTLHQVVRNLKEQEKNKPKFTLFPLQNDDDQELLLFDLIFFIFYFLFFFFYFFY
jgi:hypothetical protein